MKLIDLFKHCNNAYCFNLSDILEEEAENLGMDTSVSPHSVHFQMDEVSKSPDSGAGGVGEGLPPRPPTSSRLKDKSSSRTMQGFEQQQISPARSHTPSSSSGHHSAGSKLSVTTSPTPTPSGSPAASASSASALMDTAEMAGASKPNHAESTIIRLRREVEALKNAFASSQKRWSDVSTV